MTLDPAQVTLKVDLQVSGQVRRVIPEVTGTDALAPGYELVRPPTVVPSDQVIIDGPPDQIAKVLYLTTEPIDITGWSESKDLAGVKIDTSKLPPDVTVDLATCDRVDPDPEAVIVAAGEQHSDQIRECETWYDADALAVDRNR